jgi:RNA polymerase sigma factor (sigma-70 family)
MKMARIAVKRKVDNTDSTLTLVPKKASRVLGKVIQLRKEEKKEPLTPRQREALVTKYRLKARKLGRSILRTWHSRLDLEEVDSVVDLSLCEAVRRFDPTKGASFMTFLYYHLKGNLVRAVAIAANSHSVPLFNPEDLEGVVAPEDQHFMGHQFRTLTAAEVSEALTGAEAPLPDEVLWKKELGSKSHEAFLKLDLLEREIIQRIYIAEEQIMDIARDLGYSRCHVSRVKKRALETLYDEMKCSMKLDELPERPSFDEADDGAPRVVVSNRRSVQRRLID